MEIYDTGKSSTPISSGRKKNIVYAFQYNPCTYEGNLTTVSLHHSFKGADTAMKEHYQKALDYFNEVYPDAETFDMKFGENQDWRVVPMKIYP